MRAANRFKIRPRQVVAFLLAPLAPGLLFLIPSLFGNPSEGVWALKLSAMVTYPAMVVLGVPVHLLLAKRGWTRGWAYTLAGLVIGAILAAIVFGKTVAILGAILGAATSLTFWLIARPNNSREASAAN
jgi:hypothetical protein